MGTPHRVKAKHQLNDPTSTLDGFNCNPTAAAMGADRETLGKTDIRGGQVRARTGDTSGGTTLRQVEAALRSGWGIDLAYELGAPITKMDTYLRSGRGVVVQGASKATRGTKWQASETFGGNHSWWVNEARGWSLRSGLYIPEDYLVYDPLADGRRKGIAKSPFWLPRSYLLRFLALLDVNGKGNLLGPGKAYMMWTRDTEPHFHPKHGGKKATPFPDRTRAKPPAGRRVNVRTEPNLSAKIVSLLDDYALFEAYQVTSTGQSVAGSRVWYGNHDGNRWVHSSGLSHVGGQT